jgi:hypothetical protein
MASIIQSNADVDASFEVYLSQSDYHYISPPVNNQYISPEFINTGSNPLPTNIDLYKFDEPANLWRNIKDGSGNLNSLFETQFVTGRGYAIAYAAGNYTKTFTGKLNYTTQNLTLYRTTGSGSEGWNLVGNSFPAMLSTNNNSNASNNVLLHNAAVLDDAYEALYFWDYDDYVTVNQASSSHNISPCQAFFVKASSNSQQFVLNANTQKTTTTGTFYKSGDATKRFTIYATGPQTDYNKTMIAFIDGTSNGLDPGYDAKKLKANANLALYTVLVDNSEGDYSIQSLPLVENLQVKLGIDAALPGVYTFGNFQFENLINQTIILEDKAENLFVNLNINVDYSFSVSLPGSYKERFVLHFVTLITDIGEPSDDVNTISIFSDGEEIIIQNRSSEQAFGMVELFNLAGQLLDNHKIIVETGSQITLIPDYRAGVYLVRFTSANKTITKKIVIK